MKTKKLVNCPQCGGFGFTSTPASKNYGITVCRAKTCELCHGAGVIEAPMTNADRIRAMSDEELAGFLMKLMHNNIQCFGEGMFPYHPCPQEQNCKQCGLDWLRQPAEEDKHD